MAESHRGPLLNRAPVVRLQPTLNTALKLSEDTIQQIAAIWRLDLERLRHELRPWYVRLWDVTAEIWRRG